MKQLTDSQLINLLSVGLGLTFALSGVMIYYFRNEVQHLIECLNQSFKREQETLNEWYEELKDSNDDNLRLIKEKQSYIDLYNELYNLHLKSISNSEKIELHNKKYSTICRKLYDENQNLKLENQQIAENWSNVIKEKYQLNIENKHLQEKITELESKKLKERKKK